MSRRLAVQATRAVAVVALTVGWALSVSPAALAATPKPSPTPSPSASASAASEPPLATFGLSTASGEKADRRSFLAVTGAPGSVLYDQVAVLNQSDGPLDLSLYAADAANTPDGELGLPDRTVTPKDAGTWITLGSAAVTVPPQSAKGIGSLLVPVTITIPTDAEPGQHVAGVVTSLTASGTATGQGQSATLDLEQRVGLRVFITVAGPLHPGLTISHVHATYHQADALGLAGAGSATVTYTLTNTGNTRLSVQARATASGLFSAVRTTASGKQIEELLPKASVTQTVQLSPLWPTVLDHVTVSATATAPSTATPAPVRPVTVAVWMWAVPWAYLACLVLVALAWWWLRRRARRGSGAGPLPDGAPSATPVGKPSDGPSAEEAVSPQPQHVL